MKRIELAINTLHGKTFADALQVTPRYAIHQTLLRRKDSGRIFWAGWYYTVTHVTSGHCIYGRIPSALQAARIAVDLEAFPGEPTDVSHINPDGTIKKKRGYATWRKHVVLILRNHEVMVDE